MLNSILTIRAVLSRLKLCCHNFEPTNLTLYNHTQVIVGTEFGDKISL